MTECDGERQRATGSGRGRQGAAGRNREQQRAAGMDRLTWSSFTNTHPVATVW